MAENFLNLLKDINFQIQNAQQNPKEYNLLREKEKKSRHIIIILLKVG